MELTYYGQSCFSVTIQGQKILFDPFITPNELARDIDVSSIEADYILVSHGHQDHVYDLVDIAKRTGAKIVTNFEIMNWLGSQGIDNVHPMNHGGKWDFDFGTVKYVNAIHSSMLPDGANGGNPGGFVVKTDEGNFYFAGDTALTVDMQLIPRIADLDFALLPIGDNFTMGVDDAIVACDFIDCQKIIGVHYDTFDFIKIDHADAKRKFEESGLELHLLNIGETRDF